MRDRFVRPSEGIDIDLVRRAQTGDGEAFSELFQQLHSPVLNYVYRTVGDRQAAEDITQDAFIRAHQRIGQLGPPYDFKSWVFRIASNLAIDSLRMNKRYVDLDESMDPLGPMTTKRPAERKVQLDQARQSVQDTLALMPTPYRQAIVLRELNGLGYREVASALECSYDNARQLVHRARLNFRELHGMRMMAASGAMRCRALDDLLSALQDGELSKADQKAVRAHIKACAHCKETEKDLRKVAGLVAGLTPILPSPGWVEKLLETFHAEGFQPAPVQSSPGQAAAIQQTPMAHPAASGAGAAGVATPASSWLVKLGIGAAVAMFGAGALIAAGTWAYSQFHQLPSEVDRGAVEGTVQAVIGLTPQAPTQIQAQVNEEPANPPPPLPPSPTATPTQEATQDSAVISGPPIAVALVNSNCRFGPGSIYAVIDYLLQDERTPIFGRDANWSWWVVERKNAPGTCWVANNLTDELGDTSQVPIVLAPPTPSPTPADTQAPTLSLSYSPKNPLSNQELTFEVVASDPGGIAWIEIWVRPPGQSIAALLGTCHNDTACSVIGGPYAAGQGQYYVRAEDKHGNFVESSVVIFDVSWYVG